MTRYIPPVLATLFLLASIGACIFVYYDIQQSVTLIGSARDQISSIAARDTFAKTAAQFLAQTSAERAAIQLFETPPEGTASAIELVEEAAKIAKVTATVGSATLKPTTGAHHEQLDLTVSANGTFAGIARFATVLESLPRGSYVSSARAEATDKGWFGTFVVSFIKIK